MKNGTINKVTLIGRLGRDAEFQATKSGTEFVTFSIATSHSKKLGESWEDFTTWHYIVVYSPSLTRIAKDLKTGKRVYVEGRIEHREWEKNGTVQRRTQIIASDIGVVDSERAVNQVIDGDPEMPF